MCDPYFTATYITGRQVICSPRTWEIKVKKHHFIDADIPIIKQVTSDPLKVMAHKKELTKIVLEDKVIFASKPYHELYCRIVLETDTGDAPWHYISIHPAGESYEIRSPEVLRRRGE